MTRSIEFSIGEFYHLYNRGTEKRIIFNNKNDYERFTLLLYLCNSLNKVDLGDYLRQGRTLLELFDLERNNTLVDIGAYCLMPNHFHILVKEKLEGGISLFMQKLTTAYTMYFNKKYNRTGTLFQGKFKGKHVIGYNYLKYLFAYIGLNPIKLIDKNWKENGIKNLLEAKNFLSKYEFSSFVDFCDISRKQKVILVLDNFPKYFLSKKEFNDFINDWLDYRELEF
ncbi:MAG: transposase [Candidatus Nomurabacteria bacterium]|nr:transposase [Candidatus Nomurabacteria bacterium]